MVIFQENAEEDLLSGVVVHQNIIVITNGVLVVQNGVELFSPLFVPSVKVVEPVVADVLVLENSFLFSFVHPTVVIGHVRPHEDVEDQVNESSHFTHRVEKFRVNSDNGGGFG